MDFLNWISGLWDSISNAIIDVLPVSPIYYLTSDFDSEIKDILSYINYFFPIYTIIGMAEGWLFSIGVYYVIQVILRWAKVIE